jgi:hypothetical protein
VGVGGAVISDGVPFTNTEDPDVGRL